MHLWPCREKSKVLLTFSLQSTKKEIKDNGREQINNLEKESQKKFKEKARNLN